MSLLDMWTLELTSRIQIFKMTTALPAFYDTGITLLTTGPSPGTYGYGTVWDSSAINNGTCTSTDGHSHGTVVAGLGSGNAHANGRMKGMAPESDIIMVESNFSAA